MATMLAGVVGEAVTPGPTSPSWTDKRTCMKHAPDMNYRKGTSPFGEVDDVRPAGAQERRAARRARTACRFG
jgi:hypothetical protein